MPSSDSTRVLNSCMTVPSAVGPLWILSVTSAPNSSASPLKEGVRSLVTLPLSGVVIVTLGGAAMALAAGPTAMATSEIAAACKSRLPDLLMG